MQYALMIFQLFSHFFTSPRAGTTNIINEWTVVAVLCCHGKRSSYIPTSLVIWSFQLWVHIIKIFLYFDLAFQMKCTYYEISINLIIFKSLLGHNKESILMESIQENLALILQHHPHLFLLFMECLMSTASRCWFIITSSYHHNHLDGFQSCFKSCMISFFLSRMSGSFSSLKSKLYKVSDSYLGHTIFCLPSDFHLKPIRKYLKLNI